MDTNASINSDSKEQLEVEGTNDSCKTDFIEIVSTLVRGTEGSHTAECVSGDWFNGEVREVDGADLKQEPDNVCCALCLVLIFTMKSICTGLCNHQLLLTGCTQCISCYFTFNYCGGNFEVFQVFDHGRLFHSPQSTFHTILHPVGAHEGCGTAKL